MHPAPIRFARVACVVIVVSAGARLAGAQTNETIYEGLDFRFVTPGARAVGMGITFVGLADDATAAATNPAGLSNLQTVEGSIEFNHTNSSRQYVFQHGVASCPGTCYQTYAQSNWVTPSFASVAVPYRNFTFALFTNSEQDFRQSLVLNKVHVTGPFVRAGASQAVPYDEQTESGNIDASVRNYGVSGAWLLAPRVSVGGSLVLSTLHMNALSCNGGTDPTSCETDSQQNAKNGSTATGSSTRPSFFLGTLIKPGRRTAIGVAYYRGPRFPTQTNVTGCFAQFGADGRLNSCAQRYSSQSPLQLQTGYVVPSRLAAGGSMKYGEHWTFVGEVARVFYSELLSDNFQVVNFRFSDPGLTPANYYYDDVNEYHSGLEYKWLAGSHVVALRTGAFSNPAHSLRFRPNASITAQNEGDMNDQNFEFNVAPSRSTTVGGTFGAGMTFSNRYQVDGAFSGIRGSKAFVISLVARGL